MIIRFSLFIVTFLFLSCGKSPSSKPDNSLHELSIDSGKYRISFSPLNNSDSSPTFKGIINVTDYQFHTRIVMREGTPGVRHLQFIHTGSRCPDMNDDTNGDGILDGSEIVEASGAPLIPLDGNLNSQMQKLEEFPISNEKGHYHYSRAASLKKLMEDLWGAEENGFLGKLISQESLSLEEKSLIIYGVPEAKILPASARSFGDYSGHEGLPIACGRIIRVF